MISESQVEIQNTEIPEVRFQQGGEDLLEGADSEIGDPLLLGGVSLGGTKEFVRIDV